METAGDGSAEHSTYDEPARVKAPMLISLLTDGARKRNSILVSGHSNLNANLKKAKPKVGKKNTNVLMSSQSLYATVVDM